MSSSTPTHTRRPLPAMVFIGALLVLTGFVWVRVLDRTGSAASSDPSSCPTPKPAQPTVIPQPRAVSVLVLNATNKTGLAKKTAKRLRFLGFTVTQATNDDAVYGGHGVLPGVGEIRFGSAGATSAALVHLYLDGARMVRTDSSATTVTLALGQKYTHLHSKDTVLAAARNRELTLTPTIPPPPPDPTPTC